MQNNLSAYNRQDVEGTMHSIDRKSPDFDKTKKEIGTQFAKQPPSSELLDFHYIGHDDEFAVARTKIKTKGKGGRASPTTSSTRS